MMPTKNIFHSQDGTRTYITSEEVAKKGDWIFENGSGYLLMSDTQNPDGKYKKIVFTNSEVLNSNGVKRIPSLLGFMIFHSGINYVKLYPTPLGIYAWYPVECCVLEDKVTSITRWTDEDMYDCFKSAMSYINSCTFDNPGMSPKEYFDNFLKGK